MMPYYFLQKQLFWIQGSECSVSLIHLKEKMWYHKLIKEEATTLAESMVTQDESDDVRQTSSGIQRTKGEHKLMKLLGDVVQGSTEDQHLLHLFKKPI